MKKNITILMALVTLVLMSCQTGTQYETVIIDDMFSIDVPTYMEKLDLENQDAAYTAGDSLQERYIMVIYETKEEIASYGLEIELTHEYYSQVVVEMFAQAFLDPTLKQINETPEEINGIPAYHYKVTGDFAEVGEEIYSYITILETDKSFYTIYSWSLLTDERNFSKEAEYIAKSFKEL